MLNCKEVSHLATEYSEGQGSLATRLQIRMHLIICRHCRRFRAHLLLSRRTAARLARQLWREDPRAVDKVMEALNDNNKTKR